MVRYVYRALRDDENPSEGIHPKNPRARFRMTEAVENSLESQYILTTKERLVALYFAEEFPGHSRASSGHCIVLIDLDRVPAKHYDCSDGSYMDAWKAQNFAIREELILIRGTVPAHAIIRSVDTRRWTPKIQHCGRNISDFFQQLDLGVRADVENLWGSIEVEVGNYPEVAKCNTEQAGNFYIHNKIGEGEFKIVVQGNYTPSGRPKVNKFLKSGTVFDDSLFLDDLRAARKSLQIIDAFSHYLSSTFAMSVRIQLNVPECWMQTAGDKKDQRMLVEPFIENFKKWNSNTMEERTAEAAVANALSHFSFHHSGGDKLLCDLQGGYTDGWYVISDVVLHSRGRRFGPSDLGKPGIATWMAGHQCNSFCAPGWSILPGARRQFRPTMSSTMKQKVSDFARRGVGGESSPWWE